MKHLVDDFREVRFLAVALLALVVLFAVNACGSDSSDGSTSEGTNASAPVITKAQLIKKGDAICRKADKIQNKRMEAYVKEHPEVMDSKAALGKAMKEVALPPIHTEIEKLAALGMPQGDEAELTTILGDMEKALRTAEKNPITLVSFDEGPFIAPGKLAAQYGFKDCSGPL